MRVPLGAVTCPENMVPDSTNPTGCEFQKEGVCFLPMFPFIGQRVVGSPTVCSAIISVPSEVSWVVTIGLGALAVFGLFNIMRGGR